MITGLVKLPASGSGSLLHSPLQLRALSSIKYGKGEREDIQIPRNSYRNLANKQDSLELQLDYCRSIINTLQENEACWVGMEWDTGINKNIYHFAVSPLIIILIVFIARISCAMWYPVSSLNISSPFSIKNLNLDSLSGLYLPPLLI
jgi:hypothetical protein